MVSKGKPSPDQLPLFTPQSSWVPPSELPDLSNVPELALDVETRDDKLAHKKGPGFYQFNRADVSTGFITGISAAWGNQSIYIPVRHRDTICFDFELVQRWLKSLARQQHTRFIFHNFQYDWGWIQAVFNIPPPEVLDDTGAMAAMVDENQPSFKLEDLCTWQGLPGKDETLLNEALQIYSCKGKEDLWRLPGKYVGPYAEQDAVSTFHLAKKLRALLVAENLEEAYKTECELLPVTLSMKQRGIRVDVERTTQLHDVIKDRCKEELTQLSSALGTKVEIKDIRRSAWLKEQFEKIGLAYPRTAPTESYAEGQASFEKNFMANHEHWFPRAVYQIKHKYELADKFLKKFILDYHHKGRVYPSVNQFRSEEGGTRSHRFSYSDPALQQMPSRDDEYAPLIRSCFLPEEEEEWGSIDYRQQEYRLIVFVAELKGCKGAKQAADQYRSNPDTDYHDWVAQITHLQRKRAKDVNFAKSYGAGVKKFALMTGMGLEEAERTMKQYDERLPFVKDVAYEYTKFASENGYIEMLDGARNHFNLWEPIYRDYAKEFEYKKKYSGLAVYPCYAAEGRARREDPQHPWYGERFKRAFTHKALNRMIQGTAARQIKRAMVDISKAGYPILLQIHDELGFSFARREDGRICAKIMEEAMPIITIPMLTDLKFGKSWGDLKK